MKDYRKLLEPENKDNFTDYGLKLYRLKAMNEMNAGIAISESVLTRLAMYLIPIKIDGKYGFIDKDANLVINPLYDSYADDFDDDKSLVRVSIDGKWGVIDVSGNNVLPLEFQTVLISDNERLFTVSKNYETAVINDKGLVIVDYGEYDFVDGFDSGLARVRIGKKMGIIDSEGAVVLPVYYDNVWNFYKKGRSDTKIEKDGRMFKMSFNELYRPNFYDRPFKESSYTPDYHRPAFDYPEYDDTLDADQQSIDFWNNF